MGWFEEQIRDRVQNDDDLFGWEDRSFCPYSSIRTERLPRRRSRTF